MNAATPDAGPAGVGSGPRFRWAAVLLMTLGIMAAVIFVMAASLLLIVGVDSFARGRAHHNNTFVTFVRIAAPMAELLLLLGVPLLIVYLADRSHLRDYFQLGRFRPAVVLPAAAVIISWTVAIIQLSLISAEEFGGPKDMVKFLERLMSVERGGGWMPMLFLVAIIPAVAEEFLFRGFLLGGLQRGLPFWAALLISAFLFAFVHISPSVGPTILVVGIIFALLVHWTKSLWYCVIMHAIYNATALVAGNCAPDYVRDEDLISYPVLLVAMASGLLALVWLRQAHVRHPEPELDTADAAPVPAPRLGPVAWTAGLLGGVGTVTAAVMLFVVLADRGTLGSDLESKASYAVYRWDHSPRGRSRISYQLVPDDSNGSPVILRLMDDPKPEVRLVGLTYLQQRGSMFKRNRSIQQQTLQALLRATGDDAVEVRTQAQATLTSALRYAGTDLLRDFMDQDDNLARMLEALRHPDAADSQAGWPQHSAELLPRLVGIAGPAGEFLLELLNDNSPALRQAALVAARPSIPWEHDRGCKRLFESHADEIFTVLEAIVACTRDESPEVREAAMQFIRKLQDTWKNETATDALLTDVMESEESWIVSALGSSNEELAELAKYTFRHAALQEHGVRRAEELLRNDHAVVRAEILAYLRRASPCYYLQQGQSVEERLDLILACLADEDARIRLEVIRFAAEASKHCSELRNANWAELLVPAGGVPVLVEAVQTEEGTQRSEAIRLAGQTMNSSPEAVTALHEAGLTEVVLDLLARGDHRQTHGLVYLIEMMAPHAPEAVEAVQTRLDAGDYSDRIREDLTRALQEAKSRKRRRL